jgi:hypothetical protein
MKNYNKSKYVMLFSIFLLSACGGSGGSGSGGGGIVNTPPVDDGNASVNNAFVAYVQQVVNVPESTSDIADTLDESVFPVVPPESTSPPQDI